VGAVDQTLATPPATGRPFPVALVLRASRRLRALTAAERVAYGATSVYAAVFTFFAVARHLAFRSQELDLGDMTQAIWNTLHGHLLQVTMQNGDQVSRLAVHVDPFLVLLVPVWWIWPSPLMLLVLQALAVAAGAFPVFWLARKHLRDERAAAFLAVAYLAYPATQFNAFAPSTGFHPVSLALPLLLLAVWFLDEDRLIAFSVVALLVMTTKEEMPAVVGLLGLWYGVRSRRWRFALPLLACGIALTLIDFLVVMPHFLGGKTFFGDRYASVGGDPSGVLHTAFTDPLAIVRDVATVHKLAYLLLLFLPLLGTCLLEPLLLLPAVPDLVINLLSDKPEQTTVQFHYTAGIAPFVFAAAVVGLGRRRGSARRVSLYVMAAVATTAAFSPLVLGAQHVGEALSSNALHRAKAQALALIPQGVPVSASNQLGAHLAARRRIMVFPAAVAGAQWIVVDRADPTYGDEAGYERRIAAFRRSSKWRLAYASHGVLVFHRARMAG
jgi:uncharacterized membrane protein